MRVLAVMRSRSIMRYTYGVNPLFVNNSVKQIKSVPVVLDKQREEHPAVVPLWTQCRSIVKRMRVAVSSFRRLQ